MLPEWFCGSIADSCRSIATISIVAFNSSAFLIAPHAYCTMVSETFVRKILMSNSVPVLPLPAQPLMRLASIDAYRGFVMFLMMAEILHLSKVAKAFSEVQTFWGDFWRTLAYHQTHVEWVGCSLHDMIQPSFSFLVGVALPFSIASRMSKGQSYSWMTIHAFWRALVLVLLGVFLRSQWGSQTNWVFEDTLSQIGLGYGVCSGRQEIDRQPSCDLDANSDGNTEGNDAMALCRLHFTQ